MISLRKILFVAGLNLLLFSVPLFITMLVGLIYQEVEQVRLFFNFSLCLLVIGLITIMANKNFLKNLHLSTESQPINIKEGYIITATTWISLCLLASVPFYLFISKDITFAEAIFEGTSGMTTTGGTILADIEMLPTTIKFYRQFLQWIGGFGIIILAVAILPMLGIGTANLFSSEKLYSYGNAKISPKFKDTAMALFKIYCMLTIFCTLGYFYTGMNFFDSLVHSFSTVSTGGFSTYNDNLMNFSRANQVICIIFMFLSSINMSLHYYALRGNTIKTYFRDVEFRVFLYLILAITLISTIRLVIGYDAVEKAGYYLFHSLFNTLSIVSSSGFYSTDFFNWGFGVPLLILCASFISGCSGSTTGGIKIIRFVIIFKQIGLELRKLINPHASFLVRTDEIEIKSKAVLSVISFFALFLLTFFGCLLVLTMTGLDFDTSFYAVVASLTNTGQAIGDVSSNFSALTDTQTLILSFAMLIGRLELFAILILFTPQFWRY